MASIKYSRDIYRPGYRSSSSAASSVSVKKKGIIITLFEIFPGPPDSWQIAVMHQRLVERAGTDGSRPDARPAPRRIALMGQPRVGLEIVQLVVSDHVLGITDDLSGSSYSGHGT